jgi:hypothetical protein
MRKRGLIVLASSTPLWLFVVVSSLMMPRSQWDLSEFGDPLYLGGAKLAACVVTFVGLCVLTYDAAIWATKRIHDRHSQTN